MMQRELVGDEDHLRYKKESEARLREQGLDPAKFDFAGYNGYVSLPKRPVREKGYSGILTYVPVHGGITYAQEDELGMVYGFDTAHHNSNEFPKKDGDWIQHQCAIMLNGIAKAAEVEKNYLRCVSVQGKAKHAQAVIDVIPNYDGNFGINLNIMAGKP